MEDIIALKPYLNTYGRTWVENTEARQNGAEELMDPYDEHEATTDRENFADDDALDYDSVPQPIGIHDD